MTPFVCIEGPDGAGKTMQASLLSAAIRASEKSWPEPLVVHFPDRSTPYGHLIEGHLRQYWSAKAAPTLPAGVSLGGGEEIVNARVFQALQTANRMEVMPTIQHALADGRPVVLDRYWPSGYAYGKADGMDPEHLIVQHMAMVQPELFILLDVPVPAAVDRQVAGGRSRDRYERAIDLLEKVRQNYLELWKFMGTRAERQSRPEAWVIVDGRRAARDVHEEIMAYWRGLWG